MKRFGLLLLLIACACALTGRRAPAQSSRTESEMRAGPRDVREIFLTLPYPARPEPDSIAEAYADYLDTSEKRRRLLEHPFVKPGEYENVLDLANGYLRLNLNDNWGQYATVTSFTRADGARLVVLQLGLENHVEYDPHTEDYFYELTADGRYREVPAASVVPPLTFGDFWGDQPPPPADVRQMFSDAHLYNVEWPRRGTVAVVRSYPPFNTGERVAAGERKARAAYGARRYETLELVWDRQRGVFEKGRKTAHTGPDKTWAQGPSLPSLCAADEFDMFNCAIAERGKLLSICASQVSLLEQGRGYIQYRFGRPGRVELEFPRERRDSARAFKLDLQEAQGRSHSGALTFVSGGYQYTVHEFVSAGAEAQNVEKDGWVEVIPVSKLKDGVQVTHEFRCLAPVQGTLRNLKGFVAPASHP